MLWKWHGLFVCLPVTMLWKWHGLFYCLFTCDNAKETAQIVCFPVTMLWKWHGLFVYCLFTCDDAVEAARIGGEVGVVAVDDSFAFLTGAARCTQTCKLP